MGALDLRDIGEEQRRLSAIFAYDGPRRSFCTQRKKDTDGSPTLRSFLKNGAADESCKKDRDADRIKLPPLGSVNRPLVKRKPLGSVEVDSEHQNLVSLPSISTGCSRRETIMDEKEFGERPQRIFHVFVPKQTTRLSTYIESEQNAADAEYEKLGHLRYKHGILTNPSPPLDIIDGKDEEITFCICKQPLIGLQAEFCTECGGKINDNSPRNSISNLAKRRPSGFKRVSLGTLSSDRNSDVLPSTSLQHYSDEEKLKYVSDFNNNKELTGSENVEDALDRTIVEETLGPLVRETDKNSILFDYTSKWLEDETGGANQDTIHSKLQSFSKTKVDRDGWKEAYNKAVAIAQIYKDSIFTSRVSKPWTFSFFQGRTSNSVYKIKKKKGGELKHILGRVKLEDYYPGGLKNPKSNRVSQAFLTRASKMMAKRTKPPPSTLSRQQSVISVKSYPSLYSFHAT
ncbi:DgyrCDS14054 [Dimorphilus gyrociliatus]|uniref:DgyrCDS14054 n=1 Tax=Dimorphilus gyrociliatus TaxID=2664684 RepID=A0A7I8WCE8_9ANNE|nr:DgyrCDS14054 [Dimorphilus gyrociliatus]